MSRIHNPHLVQRLARSQPAAMALLGHGLDAIIQCTRRRPESLLERILQPGGTQDHSLPIEPSARARLDRYYTALHYAPSTTIESHWAREVRGVQVKAMVRAIGGRGKVASLDARRLQKRSRIRGQK